MPFLILVIIICMIVALFAVQNAVAVSLNFVFWSFSASLVLVILGAFLMGVLVATCFLLTMKAKHYLKDKKMREEMQQLQTENKRLQERVAMLREACKNIPNVEIDSFNGLTVSFAKQKGATVMVRGLRAVTDFENEIQLAHTNYAMMPEIETVFLATAIKWSYLSSTIVREAAHYGQDVSRFVPRNVERALIAKREAGEL